MLPEQDIPKLRARKPDHAHLYPETHRYFEGNISESTLVALLGRLGESSSLCTNGRACALYGYGSQTRRLYRAFDEAAGLDVVWRADFGPWWLRPLGLIMAAHGGFIRANDASIVPEAVQALAHLAMVEVYSFNRELWPRVEAYVRRATWRSFIGSLVGREDRSYFCLGVDGDAQGVDGYATWCSFGMGCPEDLRRVPSVSV